jgi:hypothetical protein
MVTFLSAPRAYLNFALKLRGFLKKPVTESDARETILQQLVNREENFIKALKTNVFLYPRSPYLPLFKAAQLTHTDVKRMVNQRGLERTLDDLYDAGIYITFEEFKGRTPIKRGNLEFMPDSSDFDNPNLTPILFGGSGGSTGKPTRTKMDLDHIEQFSIQEALVYSAHNISGVRSILWMGILPDYSGVATILVQAHLGLTISHWFSTVRGKNANIGWYYILLTYLMIFIGRFHGLKFPFPEYIPLDNPLLIAKSLAQTVQEEGAVILESTISKCVRVSVVAKQHGIDLTGVTFYGSSEPTTPAKVATIKASGAGFVTQYGSTEAGSIGLPCANPADVTDVHFLSNSLALIQRPKEIFDQTVNAFHFTNFLPSSPKMLINVQLDDFGIVEERDCGCPLHQMGFTTHLRQIGSYRKLTGEGVTLVGSDMVHILEHVLPLQFGGSLLDYQLVEEENEQSFTKLMLYVDPSVQIEDEDALLEAFLDAMKNSMPSARLAQAEYRTGDVVIIRREKPFVTNRGKHFPIRTLNITKK